MEFLEAKPLHQILAIFTWWCSFSVVFQFWRHSSSSPPNRNERLLAAFIFSPAFFFIVFMAGAFIVIGGIPILIIAAVFDTDGISSILRGSMELILGVVFMSNLDDISFKKHNRKTKKYKVPISDKEKLIEETEYLKKRIRFKKKDKAAVKRLTKKLEKIEKQLWENYSDNESFWNHYESQINKNKKYKNN